MDDPFVVLLFCWGVPLILVFVAGYLVGRGYRMIFRLEVKEDVD